MTASIIARILIVDDDAQVAKFYKKSLESAGYDAHWVSDLTSMRDRIKSVSFDLVLLDLNLGDESGFDGLNSILKDAPFTKVFVLTSHGSIKHAVDAMQRGAHGFFEKGAPIEQLLADLLAAVQVAPLSASDLTEVGLIGRSEALLEVIEKLRRLRDVDSTVLILGESGTGKEVLARAIHRLSRRSNNRFDAINCAAIPEALLESELFGHKRGAFTDAKTDRKGIFELCSEGTLLLDEIGDMPLATQAKLLRVMQEWEVTPVGSSQSIKVNTRVIAATNCDILQLVKKKHFREDLFFRFSVIVLRIPPLRERRDDIPLLAEHFLKIFNQRFERNIRMPNATVMSRMLAYKWPGNVRELQNALERAVVLAQSDEIDVKDLFSHLAVDHSEEANMPQPTPSDANTSIFDLSLTEARQSFDKSYLEFQLERYNGQITDVAERSGRYRADVYRLMSRYNIDHGKFRGAAEE